jgi:hypothetical protein
MKYLVVCLTLVFVGGFVAYTWKQEGESIKNLFGMGDPNSLYGHKSIIEDLTYWFPTNKWADYQQQRMDAQGQRAIQGGK